MGGLILTIVFTALAIALGACSFINGSAAVKLGGKTDTWGPEAKKLWDRSCDFGSMAVISGLAAMLSGISCIISMI